MTIDLSVVIDTLWMVIASILVFSMQAGFTLVESGFTRSKNAANIMMKNFMDYSIGTIIFFIVGFSLMFHGSVAGLFGIPDLCVSGDYTSLGLIVPLLAFVFFQSVFCSTSVTIVSGAVAERMKFSSYLIFSSLMTAIIYPISGHWVWGGGWLAQLGFHDFAGSSVVHALGGFAALAGIILLGARRGKFNQDGSSNTIHGHSLTMAALGVFILWIGWFGFNAGSTLTASDPWAIAHVVMTTNLAPAAAAVTTLMMSWFKGKPSVGAALNGSLAGLVAITAGCDLVSPLGAIAIGVIAGMVMMFGNDLLERKFKLDDAVGAIPVHGFCGVVGTILTGLFSTSNGLFYTGSFSFLGIQIIGAFVIALWGFVMGYLLLALLKKISGIRVSATEEENGLDLSEHAESAYGEFLLKEDVKTSEN
ncbi:ammonium transporter [Turicibacter sanguinis]|uniref:ammonium transporter n=1 Tax=Turicibacter sanguinis TaxID=154288 RepID=UPI0018AB9CC3|nr:ammonium transporter [Turicibacter sanguinis]MCU7200828.1 ammonium transporter [Turicibacter sanguinis]